MEGYKAPLKDMQFVLHDVLKVGTHYQSLDDVDVDPEIVDSVLKEGASFAEKVVAPTNRTGDEEGAKLVDGQVTTPTGFKEAYKTYCDDGWAAIAGPEEYGGQALPFSLATPFREMLLSANLSWRLYSGLTEDAIVALKKHGSDEQKALYLPKLISGHWSATMCLTEAHSGTDLAILSTQAIPNDDDSFAITGTKIFITSGEHDLTDNILHLVLARLPDAPKGVKGISLFLVPKFLPDDQGNPGELNTLECGALEKKMGIKGSATCVMNFDGAKGWLLGPPNTGLACMFTMMNDARFEVAMQGLGIAEMSFQKSVGYAIDRLQSRSLTGPKVPEQIADPIIVHPDVRRMLLTQKSLVEGCRLLAYYTAMHLDQEHSHPDEQVRALARRRVAFLIPIVKGFLTETSLEVTNLGVQVFGGHGYIAEWGMEQLMRDSRITMLYEGTNGIQALDLIRRKVLGDQGDMQRIFANEIKEFCEASASVPELADLLPTLQETVNRWNALTEHICQIASDNPEEIGACSMDYLLFSSLTLVAWFWAQMAKEGLHKASASSDKAFGEAKLETARFYFQRILPRTHTYEATVKSGAHNLMALQPEQFCM